MKMLTIWMVAGLILILAITCTVLDEKDYVINVVDGDLYGTHHKVSDEKVVLIIAGSGPTDRDGNSPVVGGRNDSLKELADALNAVGYSTFTYDKRTSGKSADTFKLSEVVFQDFVNDTNLVLEALKNLGYTDVSIIGHSQGALIAEMVGTDPLVSHVISLCGTIRPIDEVLIEQLASLSKETFEAATSILNNLQEGEALGDIPEPLEMLFGHNNNFLLSWMEVDPMTYIDVIEDKLLFIYGEADTQVSVDEIVGAKASLNWVLIPDMNHVLKSVQSDAENNHSYSKPIYPISEDLVDEVLSFLHN